VFELLAGDIADSGGHGVLLGYSALRQ